MNPENRLKELGIKLPAAPKPLGSYVTAVRTGNLVYLSGMLPLLDGKLAYTGKVGKDLTLEQGHEAARLAALNALAVLRDFTGDLNRVTRCVKISGHIACTPEFTDQPKVINAASDLMVEVFGEAGKHTRAALGALVLPLDSPVELEFIFEVS